MGVDVLSDLLRAVRLRGALFYHVEGVDPWTAQAPPTREVIPGVMPGADHLIAFHGIAGGSCWTAIEGVDPLRLDEGDVIVYPQGDAHVMSSAPRASEAREPRGSYFPPRPPQMPFTISVGEAGIEWMPIDRRDSGGRARTSLVCGFLGCDAKPYNPLLAALPRVMVMRGAAAEPSSWVSHFLRIVVDEANRKQPGGAAVLERMSEMLFVEILRRHVDGLPPDQTGWLAGMHDPGVGRALSLLHGSPGEAWTVERLGDEAGVSRSVLHERFVHFIGQPPMQYLTNWRMQLASARLRDSEDKLIEIALDVGYESEAAFSRAFRRVVGVAPGAWRRARRAAAKATASAPA